MKDRACICLLDKENILLIHRITEGKNYYVLPGGWVEPGEDIVSSAIREAREEASIDIKISSDPFKYIDPFDGRIHFLFQVSEFSGEVRLGWPEAKRHNVDDQYILEWHPLESIPKLNFFPDWLKEYIKILVR